MNGVTTRLLASGVCLALAGCAAPPEATDFRPSSTVQDIMLSVIDPSADAIWQSVSTVVDQDGVHEEFPETDEEWEALRQDAIRLVEASNLLIIPGRSVAAPGVRSEYPGIELEPEQIQTLIDEDRETFVELAHGLHETATTTLQAIEARDAEALLASGEMLDVSCERCHLNYWYPDDTAAREIFEANERMRLEQMGPDVP